MSVLDLGAAPGGWSLYASEQLSHLGTVVAVDLLSLDKTLQSTHSDISSRIKANLQSNFHYVQGDFTNNDVRVKIMEMFSTSKSNNAPNSITEGEEESGGPHAGIDLIISDMAANFLGDQQTDALRTIDYANKYWHLRVTQHVMTKEVYEMEVPSYVNFSQRARNRGRSTARDAFQSVHIIKPKASRKESSEQYLLALDFNFNCK